MEGERLPSQEKAPQSERGTRLCPHVQEPMEGCYCASLGSQDIEAAIEYCKGRFEECEIYKRFSLERLR